MSDHTLSREAGKQLPRFARNGQALHVSESTAAEIGDGDHLSFEGQSLVVKSRGDAFKKDGFLQRYLYVEAAGGLRPATGEEFVTEIYGKGDQVGRLIRDSEGSPLQVVEVVSIDLWDEDRCHDEDEFGRLDQTGWYTTIRVRPVDETEAERLAREAAERQAAEDKRRKREAAEEKQKEIEAKHQAWKSEIAGLTKTDAAPADYQRTGRFFDSGYKVTCEEIELPGGAKGWYVSWIGDMDGCYWLLPSEVASSAEAEKARLHRIYQWWRPEGYGADSYPGPGVPEAELTVEEKAEVAARFAAKYAAEEEKQRRSVTSAVVRGDYKNARGCDAWEALTALGAELEVVIPPEEFKAFAKGMADHELYSKERDALLLEVVLRAKLPPQCFTKRGEIKAAVARQLPTSDRTANRFVRVRVEYVD